MALPGGPSEDLAKGASHSGIGYVKQTSALFEAELWDCWTVAYRAWGYMRLSGYVDMQVGGHAARGRTVIGHAALLILYPMPTGIGYGFMISLIPFAIKHT